jgi:hypothetical protein
VFDTQDLLFAGRSQSVETGEYTASEPDMGSHYYGYDAVVDDDRSLPMVSRLKRYNATMIDCAIMMVSNMCGINYSLSSLIWMQWVQVFSPISENSKISKLYSNTSSFQLNCYKGVKYYG